MTAKIPHLHPRKNARGVVYFRYKMPDGHYESLGKDRRAAETIAKLLNAKREAKEEARTALNSLEGIPSKSMRELIDHYEPVKLRSTKSAASQEEWQRKFRRYREWMGDWSVVQVSVAQLDSLLEEKATAYDPYRLHRLLIGELFTYAIGKGWRRESDGNPGRALLPPKLARVKGSKVRKRMSLDIFYAIRREAPAWLQLAMDLALNIGIRRRDVCYLKLESFRDGHLFLIPSKTADLSEPAAIQIPLTSALSNLVKKSRGQAPLSPFFLHRNNSYDRVRESAHREHRTQVLPDQLTRHFLLARGNAVKKRPDLFNKMKLAELPTFHEIRSLCAKMYQQQGKTIEEVQTLLGHASQSMTELYQTGYGIQWQLAYADLDLSG